MGTDSVATCPIVGRTNSPRLENTIFPSSLKEEVELEARKQGFENRKYARRNRIGKLRYEMVVKIEKKIGRIRIEIKEKKIIVIISLYSKYEFQNSFRRNPR